MFEFLSTTDTANALAGIHFAIRRITFRGRPAEGPQDSAPISEPRTTEEEIGLKILRAIEQRERVELQALSGPKAQEYTKQLADLAQELTSPTIDRDRGRELLAGWKTEPLRDVSSAPSTSGRLSQKGMILLAAYLLVTFLLLAYFCFAVWPVKDPLTGGWSETLRIFGFTGSINLDVRLILLAMAAGGLGASIHTNTSFVDFVGNRTMSTSWVAWFVFRPFVGMALATVVYFALRATVMGDTPNTESRFYGIAAISGLIGMFSKQGADKLTEVFSTLFKTAPTVRGGRGDVLISEPPEITSIEPNKGSVAGGDMISVVGSGFSAGAQVTFGGSQAAEVAVSNPTLLTAVTPAHPAGSVDISVKNDDGQSTLRVGGYTFVD